MIWGFHGRVGVLGPMAENAGTILEPVAGVHPKRWHGWRWWAKRGSAGHQYGDAASVEEAIRAAEKAVAEYAAAA